MCIGQHAHCAKCADEFKNVLQIYTDFKKGPGVGKESEIRNQKSEDFGPWYSIGDILIVYIVAHLRAKI